ncbi:MAG TPA: DUF5615 family PIN-like protein [Vicinamibacterales bacterium]|nr:DUF5615 family PIN-like protein [Vicinamibacterales bacterium]
MKLLFDENLSHQLETTLGSEFPGSVRVRNIGLRGADDAVIWDHARKADLIIVSKDTDFRERSYLEGFPPKIIWLDVGNAGTGAIAQLMVHERQRIEHFGRQEETSLLILSIGLRAI